MTNFELLEEMDLLYMKGFHDYFNNENLLTVHVFAHKMCIDILLLLYFDLSYIKAEMTTSESNSL